MSARDRKNITEQANKNFQDLSGKVNRTLGTDNHSQVTGTQVARRCNVNNARLWAGE